ncbi:AAA domain-containing protein, putative AbiEii toxin, Type IV TA system [Cyclobacterium lianum]|uniref:AAA domain-containing protein, putative AbiEii toxin, Type IV TA system n=1 Tax=Cyclobacterium lianum TaxID=388280 RepID=A0A1M7PZ82_9BACT|nr:AAA family ATPase [Cyclobacterium lianum]SHN23072.1 AAA domain-containing protein, putative AbiEii toxin, Type IV TA system [Cyclobacterium lianum]
MYQSEIRDSTIQALIEKARNRNYGKYLCKVFLNRVRGLQNQTISFDFPVTAIIGTNGGGKTTIIGSSAIIYKHIQPKKYFARGGNFDLDMANWEIQYELIDRTKVQNDSIRRTANYRRLRWNRDPLERQVLDFGVSRTVPPIEKNEFNRFANSKITFDPSVIHPISNILGSAIGRILGKDISQFKYVRFTTSGKIDFLSGTNEAGQQFSEFHFGAGESSIIRMVSQIEALPENSLVLIEEIENGLHPVATIKMVEYLIDVAFRNKIQTIFTTHSNDALKPLPDMAIWATITGKLFQGKLNIHSLRAISGEVEASLVIFVEDPFAKMWIESILRSLDGIVMETIEIHPLSGDGNAIKMHNHHTINPTTTDKPSVCIIDGDSRQNVNIENRIYRLPGESPETYIFNSVLEKMNEFKIILAAALHKKPDDADKIEKILKEVKNSNMDPHLLFSQVGLKLGLLPEDLVKMAFLTVWNQAYPEEAKTLIDNFDQLIPKEK